MAANNPAPTAKTGRDAKYIRLKAAAHEMSVSYDWIYERIVNRKAVPFKRRGRVILVLLGPFKKWSEQDDIP